MEMQYPEAAQVPGQDGAAEAAPPEPDIWSRVAELDPEELLKRHPELQRRFHGAVGGLANRQAQQMTDQRVAAERARLQAEAEERAREAELDRLRQTDLFQWDQKDREYQAQKRQQALQQQAQSGGMTAAMAAYTDIDQQILLPMVNVLPPDAQQELYVRAQQRQLQGMAGAQSRQAWVSDVLQMHAVHVRNEAMRELEKARASEATEARKVGQLEQLARQNGGQGVDSGFGAPTDGIPNLMQWAGMSTRQRSEILARDPEIENRIMQQAEREGQGRSFGELRMGGSL